MRQTCRDEADEPWADEPWADVPPYLRPQDSDLWAIYARGCLGQLLTLNERAALVDDPEVEAVLPDHTQPARPAPRAPRGRR